MKRFYFLFQLLILFLFLSTRLTAQSYKSIVNTKLDTIKMGLDTNIFVSRFESIETPCVYIDPGNNLIATTNRQVINSDYRIFLKKNKTKDSIATDGVKCLSQYCSRYMRLVVKEINEDSLNIKGTIEFTYSYPASSIIQYLGYTENNLHCTDSFFNKLIKSSGTFVLYPEDDKYRIKVVLPSLPYDSGDAVYGYLEIVKSQFNNNVAYNFFFDKMSIKKGDNNNQIFLKFTSTNHRYETIYHETLAYNTLKYLHADAKDSIIQKASALWLDNFFKNEACATCKTIYNEVLKMANGKSFRLPNTEPLPSH